LVAQTTKLRENFLGGIFLAAQLGILPRQIALMRGHKSRSKLIRIEGLSEREVQERFGVRN
jgi:uncharacterized protein YggU (UPF0235/DUF167 family)